MPNRQKMTPEPTTTSNIHPPRRVRKRGRTGGHSHSIQAQQSKDTLMMIMMQSVLLIMTLFKMRSSHLGEPPAYLRRKAIYLRRRGSRVRKCYSDAAEWLTTQSVLSNHCVLERDTLSTMPCTIVSVVVEKVPPLAQVGNRTSIRNLLWLHM